MMSTTTGDADDWSGEEVTMVTQRPQVDHEEDTAPLHISSEDFACFDEAIQDIESAGDAGEEQVVAPEVAQRLGLIGRLMSGLRGTRS